MKEKQIEFQLPKDLHGVIPEPKPAMKCIPTWYKKMDSNCIPEEENPARSARVIYNGKNIFGGTMKTCPPIRDYLCSGYIVPLWCELHVDNRGDNRNFAWTLDISEEMIQSHSALQVSGSPLEHYVNSGGIQKLYCPWTFHTPKGYSSLFFSPRYTENQIEILPAIVDTDKWHQVHFPFVFHGEKSAYNFAAGTPLIQVLPFKRDSWSMKVSEQDPEEYSKHKKIISVSFSKVYEKVFKQRKVFR